MFAWQSWKNPEWIHLFVSCLGVRVGRTLGVNEFICVLIVFALGFFYEVIYDYIIKKTFISLTDLIADALGCVGGVMV